MNYFYWPVVYCVSPLLSVCLFVSIHVLEDRWFHSNTRGSPPNIWDPQPKVFHLDHEPWRVGYIWIFTKLDRQGSRSTSEIIRGRNCWLNSNRDHPVRNAAVAHKISPWYQTHGSLSPCAVHFCFPVLLTSYKIILGMTFCSLERNKEFGAADYGGLNSKYPHDVF